MTGTVSATMPFKYNTQYFENISDNKETQMAQPVASFRTTTPSALATTDTTTKQVNPVSLEKSQAPTQWKDFCEQTPIDEARHSVTIFHLL